MKYMVMECHKAYAVLMDEASHVVYAANLHYEVGQTVESPVLLPDQEKSSPRISVTMRRCITAAACAALLLGGGALYYHGNYMAYSTVMVCADEANMTMAVSRSGRVLSVQPLNQDAAAMLSDYECSGKDPLTVTNELIERAVENGYVQKGDTVGVYYQKEKSKDTEAFQKHVEQTIASHELHADVHGELDHDPIPPQAPADPPQPPAEPPEAPVKPEDPPIPPQHDKADSVPSPPVPPAEEKAPAPEADPPVKPEDPAAPVQEPGAVTAPEPEAPSVTPPENKPEHPHEQHDLDKPLPPA